MRRMLFLTILLTFCHVRLVIAEVPALINYQGTLKDAQGQPIASDTRKLTFNIYNEVTGEGLIWGPQIFNTVPVINGIFNVILGSTDTAGRSITQAFSEQNRFLGITIDDDVESTPRQQILSAPFALNAERADNAKMADMLGAGVVRVREGVVDISNSNVGIGVTSPESKLMVSGSWNEEARALVDISNLGEGLTFNVKQNTSRQDMTIAKFSNSNGQVMSINAGGNVEVGNGMNSTLKVNGYIKISSSVAGPSGADCNDPSEYGRLMVMEDSINKLCVCSTGGWYCFH